MTELLLKLLGAKVEDAVHIAKASLAFRGGLDVGWYVVLLLLTAAAVGWMYRASPVTLSPARKYALTALRVISFSSNSLLTSRKFFWSENFTRRICTTISFFCRTTRSYNTMLVKLYSFSDCRKKL